MITLLKTVVKKTLLNKGYSFLPSFYFHFAFNQHTDSALMKNSLLHLICKDGFIFGPFLFWKGILLHTSPRFPFSFSKYCDYIHLKAEILDPSKQNQRNDIIFKAGYDTELTIHILFLSAACPNLQGHSWRITAVISTMTELQESCS